LALEEIFVGADDQDTSSELADRRFLERAVELADEGMRSGMGGPFGAVVVRSDEAIAEGCNQVTSANDPTAHAEIVAIRRACRTLDTFDLSGCVLYASTEPCPMCLGAILWARLDRVVFSTPRSEAARAGFDDEHFYREVSTSVEGRELPCSQILLPQAQTVLERWTTDEGKQRY
jgi:tRNA(Arg) A34 adenosine deaminase TadA